MVTSAKSKRNHSKNSSSDSRRGSDNISLLPDGNSIDKKQIQSRSAARISSSSSLNSRWSPYSYFAFLRSKRKRLYGSDRLEKVADGLPPEVTLIGSTHKERALPVRLSMKLKSKTVP